MKATIGNLRCWSGESGGRAGAQDVGVALEDLKLGYTGDNFAFR